MVFQAPKPFFLILCFCQIQTGCERSRTDVEVSAQEVGAQQELSGFLTNTEYDQEAEAAVELCLEGDLAACLELAMMFRLGNHIERDDVRFFELSEHACRGGLAQACGAIVTYSELSNYQGLVDRETLDDSVSLAISVLELGCENGGAAACVELGGLAMVGDGLDADERRAQSLFVIACDLGDGEACSMVAYMFEVGLGVPSNMEQALDYYDRACGSGFVSGCDSVVLLDEIGTSPPGRNEANLPSATLPVVAPTARRCDQGDMEACVELARLYEIGLGLPENLTHAAELYGVACAGGELYFGCIRFARCLREGIGVPVDTERASQLLNESIETLNENCDSGQLQSCLQLSQIYWTGPAFGVQREEELALEFRALACAGGLDSPTCNDF